MKLTHIVCENAGKKAKESGKTQKLADGLGLYLQAMPWVKGHEVRNDRA